MRCTLVHGLWACNYKAFASTKCKSNQGLRVCTDQGQKLGPRKDSGKGQDKRNEKYTCICRCECSSV